VGGTCICIIRPSGAFQEKVWPGVRPCGTITVIIACCTCETLSMMSMALLAGLVNDV
jgi:hypothetical protein